MFRGYVSCHIAAFVATAGTDPEGVGGGGG